MNYPFYLLLNTSIISVLSYLVVKNLYPEHILAFIILAWFSLNGLGIIRLVYLGYTFSEALRINGLRILNYHLLWNKIAPKRN